MEPVQTLGPAASLRRSSALTALLLLVPAPSLGVLAAMWAWPGPVGQGVYLAAKLWILLLPLAWHLGVERSRIEVSRPSRRGLLAGGGIGIAIGLAIAGAYLLVGRDWIDPEQVREVATRTGLASLPLYIGGALSWCFLNSLLEEYVWRWFVYRQCERLMTPWLAVPASAAFFTLHHILALAFQFDVLITVLASAGVFAGGVIWSALYLRFRQIWPGYVSHIPADIAIFVIGYLLIFR